jgi:ferredoxin
VTTKDSKNIEVAVNTGTSFSFNEEDTLLIALEKQNIEVHYHCREGYCGACRTKLKSGTVEYTTDPLAFIDDDEILPCCCIPTDNIEIELY